MFCSRSAWRSVVVSMSARARSTSASPGGASASLPSSSLTARSSSAASCPGCAVTVTTKAPAERRPRCSAVTRSAIFRSRTSAL